MRIIIAGSRTFNNYTFLEKMCDGHILPMKIPFEEITIVSGTANGADRLGEWYAKKRGCKLERFAADWYDLSKVPCLVKKNKFGKSYNALAGHNRNREMAEFASKEENGILIAFWNGNSPGTKNMIAVAKEMELKLIVIRY